MRGDGNYFVADDATGVMVVNFHEPDPYRAVVSAIIDAVGLDFILQPRQALMLLL